MDESKVKELEIKIAESIRKELEIFLKETKNITISKLLMQAFEDQKSDYCNFGQETLLDIISLGRQICCSRTIILTGNKRVVLQSFLRLEEAELSQQASTPVSQ